MDQLILVQAQSQQLEKLQQVNLKLIVVVSGSTIGVSGDTDLLSMSSGVLTVNGNVNAAKLLVGGTEITATPEELNALKGVTATKDELNILDGATVTTSELNILDGVTATKDELNILAGAAASTQS